MSERLGTVPTPEGEYFESSRFTGLLTLLGIIAAVALVLCVVGALVNPHQFSYSWLFAFAFFSAKSKHRENRDRAQNKNYQETAQHLQSS